MKKMIFFVALTIPLMAGIMFNGYQSSTQKDSAQTQPKMIVLNAAQKREFEIKIMVNENRITKLNIKIKKKPELFDPFYLKKIVNLQKENRYLKARLEAI
jgi:hypothetical protein